MNCPACDTAMTAGQLSIRAAVGGLRLGVIRDCTFRPDWDRGEEVLIREWANPRPAFHCPGCGTIVIPTT
jgi:hypothetical protein